MRGSLALAFLLPIVACKQDPSEDYGEEDLSCQYDPHDWYDSAFSAVVAADENGDFDVDPHGDVVTGRVGNYDFVTGEIGWVTSYAGEYPYVSSYSEGYGTVYANGDVDLVRKNVYEDVLGESWAEQVRTVREGCSTSSRITELDLDAQPDALPDEWADVVEWQLEFTGDDEVTYHAEVEEEYGLYVSDRVASSSEVQTSFDYADGGYVGTGTSWYDGTAQVSWEQFGAAFGYDSDYVGQDEYYLDGSRWSVYSIFDAGTDNVVVDIDIVYQYDGSGQGTYTAYQDGTTIECDLTFGAGGGTCTLDCGSYGSYDCS